MCWVKARRAPRSLDVESGCLNQLRGWVGPMKLVLASGVRRHSVERISSEAVWWMGKGKRERRRFLRRGSPAGSPPRRKGITVFASIVPHFAETLKRRVKGVRLVIRSLCYISNKSPPKVPYKKSRGEFLLSDVIPFAPVARTAIPIGEIEYVQGAFYRNLGWMACKISRKSCLQFVERRSSGGNPCNV